MREKSLRQKKIGFQLAESQAVQATTVGELNNLVKKNLNPSDIDKAEFYVSQLVTNAPTFSDGYVSKTIINLNKGQFADAISAAEKAFSLGALDRELFITASIAYRENDRLDDALSLSEKALSVHPDGPRIQRELAICKNLKDPKSAVPTIAIATTLVDVENTIESFIDYHLALGIDHLFLFFDNPAESSIRKAAKYSQVTVIKRDEQLRNLWRRLPGYRRVAEVVDEQHMARQLLNVALANRLCLKRGFDWLLHIDSDEAFYCPTENAKQHFQSLSNRDIHNIRYLNHEALPPSLDTKDYFKEATLFKVNPASLKRKTEEQKKFYRTAPQLSQQHFLFYANGKSAARAHQALRPTGVHTFSTVDPLRFLPIKNLGPACILHYPSCGFEHYWNKYKTLGDFSNKWMGGADIAATIGSLHTESRDVVAIGDVELAKKFYFQRMLISDQNLIRELIGKGVLIEIKEPQNILTKS